MGRGPGERVELTEDQAAELLAAYGIEVWPAQTVKSAEEAVTAAEKMGWPVALKTMDEHLRHRTDLGGVRLDRKSTRLNSSHVAISYAVFCLKKKNEQKKHGLSHSRSLGTTRSR